jgi:hypothetical protein
MTCIYSEQQRLIEGYHRDHSLDLWLLISFTDTPDSYSDVIDSNPELAKVPPYIIS